MSKTTYNTWHAAAFNISLLYANLARLQDTNSPVYFGINKFLINNSIHDTRISANDDTCRGMCLTVMPVDYHHVLFDSINYKTLFNITTDEQVVFLKIGVYNRVVTAFDTITHEGSTRCIINDASEYLEKIEEFIPKAINNCVKVYMHNNPYNSKQEGVYKFWNTVDAILFDERTKRELNHLKVFRGNA